VPPFLLPSYPLFFSFFCFFLSLFAFPFRHPSLPLLSCFVSFLPFFPSSSLSAARASRTVPYITPSPTLSAFAWLWSVLAWAIHVRFDRVLTELATPRRIATLDKLRMQCIVMEIDFQTTRMEPSAPRKHPSNQELAIHLVVNLAKSLCLLLIRLRRLRYASLCSSNLSTMVRFFPPAFSQTSCATHVPGAFGGAVFGLLQSGVTAHISECAPSPPALAAQALVVGRRGICAYAIVEILLIPLCHLLMSQIRRTSLLSAPPPVPRCRNLLSHRHPTAFCRARFFSATRSIN